MFGIIGILLNIRYFCHNFTQKYCKILTILFCMVNKLNTFYKRVYFGSLARRSYFTIKRESWAILLFRPPLKLDGTC